MGERVPPPIGAFLAVIGVIVERAEDSMVDAFVEYNVAFAFVAVGAVVVEDMIVDDDDEERGVCEATGAGFAHTPECMGDSSRGSGLSPPAEDSPVFAVCIAVVDERDAPVLTSALS